MDDIAKGDSVTLRQFGIVSFVGNPVTFSGTGLNGDPFQYVGGVAGQSGDLVYAIQGNSLTGAPVIDLAEQALLNTPGSLADKVLAAMVAAGQMGGDGRCSCSPDPDACGSPPPNFTKSAHQAVFVLARPGDTNGNCNGNDGCVNGDYYLFLHEQGFAADSDPVTRLAQSFALWRQNLVGQADHYASEVTVDRHVIAADGLSQATVRVQLVDLDGEPLTAGGDTLRLKRLRGGLLRAEPGEVTDHGNGTYEFPMTATFKTGREIYAVVVERSGERPVQLTRPVVVETVEPADLLASHYDWSASEDGAIFFQLDRGAAEAGRFYRLVGTNQGTLPGFDLPGGVHVPLNRGRFFDWTAAGGPGRADFFGALDADGRAQATLSLPPAWASVLVGQNLYFAAVLDHPAAEVTTSVRVVVVP